MVSFGDSKHNPVKPHQSLLVVMPFKLALSARLILAFDSVSLFLFFIGHSFSS